MEDIVFLIEYTIHFINNYLDLLHNLHSSEENNTNIIRDKTLLSHN